MLKILHVSPSFARRDGGPSEVLRGLLPALQACGLELTLVSTDKGVDESDLAFVEANRVTVYRARRPMSWTFSPGMAFGILAHVRHADLVHIHSIHTFTSTLAMAACRLAKIPYVLEPHGALDVYHMNQGRRKKSLYMRSIDRANLRALSGVIYSSVRESEQGRLELPDVASHSVPLGVDEEMFKVPRRPSRNGIDEILFLGRITQKKRLDVLLRAMAHSDLAKARFRLTVAGPLDADLGYDPSQMASDLGVADRVDFLGQVDATSRQELLSRASVFVLPSEDESFGVAVAEALASGCPTISSLEVGIAPEGARAGALLSTSLDPSALAGVISTLLNDHKQLDELGAQGRRYAHLQFTWAKSAAELSKIYTKIASGTR